MLLRPALTPLLNVAPYAATARPPSTASPSTGTPSTAQPTPSSSAKPFDGSIYTPTTASAAQEGAAAAAATTAFSRPLADDPDDELYPTENFNMIVKGVYRSAFPKKKNFSFLKKLGLRSILYARISESSGGQ